MKGQRTVKHVLGVSLSVVLLCGNLWAGPTFRDDFSDGNLQDGSPVSWGWDDDGLGERLVTPEGFRLVPSVASNPDMRPWAVVLDDEGNDALYAGNVTIRMQLRMDSPLDWGNTGVLFRAGRDGDDYMAGIILNQLFLGRAYNGTWTVLSQPTIPGFSPTGQDIIIEIDVTDFTDATGQRMSRLEVYCWFPGQTKPAQPQISAVDGTLAQGTIVLYAQRCSVTFRWVEVATEPAPTEPVVDFNGDGTVGIQDLLKMIRCWGQDEPSVDLNGDDTVDRKDLEILMDYWGQDVNDPTLLARWALDETTGEIACDSAGSHDGLLLGGPAWNPDGGRVGGALELDGQDDCITTDFVCNPAAASFSAFAWIRGGAPGQTVLSQAVGANWLAADPAEGKLMTGLTGGGRSPCTLCSDTVIADGEWHRIGLVWNGLERALYVDDVLAAEDTQSGPEACFGGLNIGCGAAMTPGTFLSGLIDDIRIYNRAVKP